MQRSYVRRSGSNARIGPLGLRIACQRPTQITRLSEMESRVRAQVHEERCSSRNCRSHHQLWKFLVKPSFGRDGSTWRTTEMAASSSA